MTYAGYYPAPRPAPEVIELVGLKKRSEVRCGQLSDGLRRLGKAIFLTTHYMDEAEARADRIAVVRVGEIVVEGTPSTLGGRARAAYQITFTLPEGLPSASSRLRRDRRVRSTRRQGHDRERAADADAAGARGLGFSGHFSSCPGAHSAESR